ncbi:MAG: Hsp20/alpha crystallin family protein [Lautropia sp.]
MSKTENDKDYRVRARVADAKKEDIKVTVDGNFVSISAEVKSDKEEKTNGDRVLVKETYFGSARRGFSLASEIDETGVVAKLEDGMPYLTLPKKTGSGARTVAIQ